jgi:hypothetical protein
MIVAHRINTLEDLQLLPVDQAIEFDVRDSNGNCIVTHDAFSDGVDFESFLQAVGQRFLIVNIKSEGIELFVLSCLEKYNCNNFFLLDCSYPKLVQLSNQKERRLAVRFSEYESIESVLALKDRVEWVWIDCFTKLPFTGETAKMLKQSGMKLCLVSPELQQQPEKIQVYIDELLSQKIYVDAVCCKQYNKELWDRYYDKICKETGLLIYHQGWTDIINCFALCQYYSRLYKKFYVFIRDDSSELHQFYSRTLPNLEYICMPLADNDVHITQAIQMMRNQPVPFVKEEDIHIIGVDDKNRTDSYKNAFCKPLEGVDFWKKFYVAYDIPYSVRVNYFEIKRDLEAEKRLYARVVKKTPYILSHIIERTGLRIHKDYEQKFREAECYELHNLSSSMFDAIELLSKAQEMVLIDSLWASVCYHLDVKYRLFRHIPITVICLRGYKQMFTEPVELANWKFVEN